MKTLLLTALVIGALPLVTTPPAVAGESVHVTGSVKVDGLSCPFCAYGLEKKIKKLPWIQKVKIHVDAGQARFFVKDGKSPDVTALHKAVKSAGFTPGVVNLNAHGTLSASKQEVVLRVSPDVAFVLDPGAKRDELLAEVGKDKAVHIEGAAEAGGTQTRIAVNSYRVMEH